MKRVRTLLAAGAPSLVAMAAPLTGGSDAQAWQYGIRQGYTGNVVAPQGTFVGMFSRQIPGACCWYLSPSTSEGIWIGRANVRGYQAVGVTYRLQYKSTYNGVWTNRQTRTFQYVMGPQQQWVQMRQPQFDAPNAVRGFWRISYLVVWSTNAGTGHSVIVGNLGNDHWCGYPVVKCTYYNGFVYIRSVGQ